MGGHISGDGDVVIRAVKPFLDASSEDITLAADDKFRENLSRSRAAAIIVSETTPPTGQSLLHVKNPKLAFAHILALFYRSAYEPKGIHPSAHIGRNTKIGSDLSVFPHVSIGDNCRIGDRVSLYPGVVIGDEVVIGDDTIVYPNVTIYHNVQIGRRVIVHSGTVIGSDGFGFVFDGQRQVKIPQVGGVEIQDEVEIGANCAVDRATLGNTTIGRGTKIDNGVQIGHNCTLGEHCVIVAQVGLSGSTKVGNQVTMAGQSATHQHVIIGDGAVVTGQAGVTKNVKPAAVVSGTPARDHTQWKRAQVLVARLPKLYEQLKRLRAEVNELKASRSKK